MDIDLASSMAQAADAANALEALEAAGCTLTDELMACTVMIPTTTSAGVPHRDYLDRLRSLSDVHLVFQNSQVSFELTGTPSAALDFLISPTGDPSAAFEAEALAVAERAWQGDIEAALSLTGAWGGEVSVHLQLPFAAQAPQLAWRAVRSVAVLVALFNEYPWWRSAELIRDGVEPVMAVVVNEVAIGYHTPSFGIASLDMLQSAPAPVGMTARRAAVRSSAAVRMREDVALPEELRPLQGQAASPTLEEALFPKAEACAWAWLSSAVEAPEGAAAASLEFFGYRRKSFDVPAAGYVGDPGQLAFNLYRWATVEESPDRILAIRQVMSLHDGPGLPGRPDDVVTAAEPLYRALRSGEVAAVLETQRQARSIAIDTAREAAHAAQTAAKSAAERTIATLAAVAGIAVANATAVLEESDARSIALGIAGLFVFLTLWTIFIEGPPMRNPLLSLSSDMPRIASLLSTTDREGILSMSVVTQAKRSVLRSRIVTPVVYLCGAGLTLLLAHARFGLKVP